MLQFQSVRPLSFSLICTIADFSPFGKFKNQFSPRNDKKKLLFSTG